MIFVDTPGIFAPKRRLEKAMVTSAWGGAADADRVGVLIDVTHADGEAEEALLARLGEIRQPKFLVLNKIDLVPHEKLLAITAQLNERIPFEATFMVSALRGHGVPKLLEWLKDKLPLGPWLYPEDEISDAPLRFLRRKSPARKSLSGCMMNCPNARRGNRGLDPAQEGRGSYRPDDLC